MGCRGDPRASKPAYHGRDLEKQGINERKALSSEELCYKLGLAYFSKASRLKSANELLDVLGKCAVALKLRSELI